MCCSFESDDFFFLWFVVANSSQKELFVKFDRKIRGTGVVSKTQEFASWDNCDDELETPYRGKNWYGDPNSSQLALETPGFSIRPPFLVSCDQIPSNSCGPWRLDHDRSAAGRHHQGFPCARGEGISGASEHRCGHHAQARARRGGAVTLCHVARVHGGQLPVRAPGSTRRPRCVFDAPPAHL